MRHFFLISLFALILSISAMAQRERVTFNKDWLFTLNDPENLVERDAKGKVSKSKLDYVTVKQWICANGADLILPTDSVKATVRPTGNLGDDVTYAQETFNDNTWRKLNLPHDWGIEGAFDLDLPHNTGKLPWAGVGWYRKHFNVSKNDTDKKIYLDIDGAMAYPMVWLNGKFVGGWAYGYSSFRLDITPYVKIGGDNVMAIRISNPENSSRWYPGSGIYRNVWLVKTNKLHVAQWGTFITTPQITENNALVNLKVKVDNKTGKNENISVTTQIFEANNQGIKTDIKVGSFTDVKGKVIANGQTEFVQVANIKNPKLWTLEKPQQYVAVTSVLANGKTVDVYETNFGLRTIAFVPNNGFLLNGKRVELKGVCNHHDLGALGTAFNLRAAERQLEIMKEMGVNALRTSHNMPAPELLDLCDRMGILVMDESFDCWKAGKTPNDYGLLYDDWHARDLRALVRRDRNHPSVIQWSIGNEILELRRPEGPRMAKHLSMVVKSEDTTRTTIAGSNYGEAGFNGFQNSVDVYGQNYYLGIYDRFAKQNPNKSIIGSETSSCVSSRGEYFFPVSNKRNEGRGRFQVSSYDLYSPGWGYAPDDQFKYLERNPFVAGEFVWTGFDYIGEPTPFNSDITNLLNFTDAKEKAAMEEELKTMKKIKSPSRSSYFGIVDLCGFKKDRFYLYQAHWRPEVPVVHILPHWTWPERVGQNTPVHVYTSGTEVELFLNGVSLGKKSLEKEMYRLRWDSVLYQPGELKAVAYKNGQKWAEEIVKTAGAASVIEASADRSSIKADGLDLSYITVKINDASGTLVPQANNLIKFEVSGAGELVATDNGNSISYESFFSKERKAYNGMALVIVRAKEGQTGKIVVKATSDGLKDALVEIEAK